MKRILRSLRWFLAFAVLLGTGALGVYNALNEWAGAGNAWQKSVTAAVGLYGVFGLIAAAGMLRRARWAYPVAIAWGVCATWAAGVSVLAYSGEGVATALPAFGGAGLIAFLIAWAVRASLNANTPKTPTT